MSDTSLASLCEANLPASRENKLQAYIQKTLITTHGQNSLKNGQCIKLDNFPLC